MTKLFYFFAFFVLQLLTNIFCCDTIIMYRSTWEVVRFGVFPPYFSIENKKIKKLKRKAKRNAYEKEKNNP